MAGRRFEPDFCGDSVGLAVNIIVFTMLTRGSGENLNMRAAALHVAGDLLGSVAALVAGVVIVFTGWTPIDPILSVFVTLIILKAAWTIVRESGHILLEGAPAGFNGDEVARQIVAEINGVQGVTHVHAWSITQERTMATLELSVDPQYDNSKTKSDVRRWLKERYGIAHVTLESQD